MTRARPIRVQKATPGMGRFFSPASLARYRKLASGGICDAELRHLLEDLAEEMNAFRREARMAAAVRRPLAFREDIGLEPSD